MKSYRQIGLVLFCIACIGQHSFGQDVLTLEEAIQTGLENNYNIRISRNNEAMAANSNTYGNAGFLPRATVAGTVSYSSSNTVQKLFSGDTILQVSLTMILVIHLVEGLSIAGTSPIVNSKDGIAMVDQVLDECKIAHTRLASRSTVNPHQGRNFIIKTGSFRSLQKRQHL